MDKLYPVLYRKGKHPGHILFWQGEVSGSRYRAHSGVLGGKVKVGVWSEASTTNEGQSNEREPSQQAAFIIEAKIAKLLKRGKYHLKKEDIERQQIIIPMTAHKYEKGKITFPVYVQPKLNGVRCLVSDGKCLSRNGEVFHSVPHIAEALHKAGRIMDGELYNHAFNEDLNELVSLVRKKTPTEAELKKSAEIVEYHVYDSFVPGREDECQDSRIDETEYAVMGRATFIKLVETHMVNNETELEALYRSFLDRGYEGAIIRDIKGVYLHDRSHQVLKYKPRYDAEFTIVRAEEGKGKAKGMLAKLYCVTKEGIEFKANVIKGKREWKKKMWAIRDELPGREATVSYAYMTSYGKPFHNLVEVIWDGKRRL